MNTVDASEGWTAKYVRNVCIQEKYIELMQAYEDSKKKKKRSQLARACLIAVASYLLAESQLDRLTPVRHVCASSTPPRRTHFCPGCCSSFLLAYSHKGKMKSKGISRYRELKGQAKEESGLMA